MDDKIKCINFERNLENCPCTNDECDKKGICCECILFHKENGGVAQLVEHLVCNQKVGGSIPSTSTKDNMDALLEKTYIHGRELDHLPNIKMYRLFEKMILLGFEIRIDKDGYDEYWRK